MRRVLIVFAGLGILLASLAVDHWIFSTWLNTTHLQWYAANGALISFVSSTASLAWGDMNKHVGLISSHPLDYLGSCLQLIGLPVYALGTHLKSHNGQRETRSMFDMLLTVPFLLAVAGAMAIWLVVIVPPQYFLFLICGAPARVLSHADTQPIARMTGTQLEIKDLGRGQQPPEGWWSASITQKPVAVTNLFVSLLFLIIKPLIG